MAITKSTNTAQINKGGSVLLIPDAKLIYVGTNKQSGKTQFGFNVAEGDEVFYVTGRLVSRNADRTGFRVFLPHSDEGYKLFRSIKGADGKYTREELVAEKIEDLGYPVEKA